MENKETDSAGGGQDRLTGLLRLWASRFTKPVERLSVNRLAALIEAYLSKEERDRGKAARQAGPRWDHDVIEGIITQGSTVLDLGCGNGELLERLIRARGVKGQGIEIDPEHVSECVARGVCVFQTDLDEGLQGFPDNFFDFIILEKTL
ncbi:MAG: methionine biosynthesis protein MetW, partial [Gemmatimonadota bacterium]|nr:methionine biosynthesis protein MetW [Gemmatimonadota bacterium]